MVSCVIVDAWAGDTHGPTDDRGSPDAGQTPLPGASLAEGIGLPVTGFANSPQDTEDLLDLIGDAPVIVNSCKALKARESRWGSVHSDSQEPLRAQVTDSVTEARGD